MAEAFPGLAPGGTLAVLGAADGEISMSPMDLVESRRRLTGSHSGSRKDIRYALEFAAARGVRPRITQRPLEDAIDVLSEMHEGRLRDRVVPTLE